MLQHKMNQKTNKARFGRLLRPPAWKQNSPVLEGVDKSESKRQKE